MRQTGERQLRAYVGAERMELELPGLKTANYEPTDPDKPGLVVNDYVLCTVKNFGATPALDVITQVNWVYVPFGQSLPTSFSYPDFESITAPGVERVISRLHLMQQQSHTTRVPIYDVDPFKQAEQQKVTVYLYGHVDYRSEERRVGKECRL